MMTSVLRRARLPAAITPFAPRTFSSSQRAQSARITIVGRLGAEPELVATSTGKEMVKYVVASSYGPKEDRKTSWFRLVSFTPEGPQRDYLLSTPKGSLVHVEADAKITQYEDAEGKKQSGLDLVQNRIDVLVRPQNPGAGEEVPA